MAQRAIIAHMLTAADLLSTTEAARQLGVSRATVNRWAKEGLIAQVRLPGGLVRVPRAEIERLLTVQPARTGT